MDYVATLRFRPNTTAEQRDGALIRRAGWQYPAGLTLITEYWPMSAELTVVSIFSTDDAAAIMEFELEWSDVFDLEIHPAVSAEQGLQIGPDVFTRLSRLQQ